MNAVHDVELLLLSKREAARLLGISERSLHDLTSPRGPIACVRTPGRILYSLATLKAWIAAEEAKSLQTSDAI